jgi:hypothetical protein
MPSTLFKEVGLSQNQAYGAHMIIYGTPTLYVSRTFLLDDLPMYFQKYVFNDWPFLTSLLLLVFLDTITGGLAALIYRRWDIGAKKYVSEFSGRLMYKKLATKAFGITIYVLSIGVLKNTVIDGEENLLSDLVDSGFYSVMIGFELASVLRNTYKIYPFEIIKWALKKLEVFYDKQTDKVNIDTEL